MSAGGPVLGLVVSCLPRWVQMTVINWIYTYNITVTHTDPRMFEDKWIRGRVAKHPSGPHPPVPSPPLLWVGLKLLFQLEVEHHQGCDLV